MNHSYLRERVHLLFVPEDLQHAGTYGTTGSWKGSEVMDYFNKTFRKLRCTCHKEIPIMWGELCLTLTMKVLILVFNRVLKWWFSVTSALTRWGDRLAAWRGQRWTGNHTACRIGSHVRHGPHSMAETLVVHSHTVWEGITHCVVGLTVMATNLLRLPTGFLRTEHTKQMYKLQILICLDIFPKLGVLSWWWHQRKV